MNHILFKGLFIALCLLSTATFAETRRTLNLYPNEVGDLTGGLTIETLTSDTHSTLYGIDINASGSTYENDISDNELTDSRLNVKFSYGSVDYQDKDKWRLFSRKEWVLPIGYRQSKQDDDTFKEGHVGVGYMVRIGAKRHLFERLSVGVEGVLLDVGVHALVSRSSDFKRSSHYANISMMDDFRVFFSIEL